MRILIIEDNTNKYAKTRKAIEEIAPQAEIFWETYAKDACDRLNMNAYDFAIIDMQMPMKVNSGISFTAGIHVLEELTKHEISMNPDIKYCISSSGEDSKDTMEKYGYEEVPFILNTPGRSIREPLKKFLGV